jgi:hypothetical protein
MLSLSNCGKSVREFKLATENIVEDELTQAIKKAENSGIPGTNISHISKTLTTLEETNLIQEPKVVDTSIFACLKDGVTEISPEHLANFGHISFVKSLSSGQESVEIVYYLSLRLYSVLDKITQGNPNDLEELLYYFSIPITKRIRDYFHIKAYFLNFLPRFHWYGLLYMYDYFYIEFPDVYSQMLALRPDDDRTATLLSDVNMLNSEELTTLTQYYTSPETRERIAALPIASQYCNGYRLGMDVIPCKEWFDINMQPLSGTPEPEDSCPLDPFHINLTQATTQPLSRWEACYYKESLRDKSQGGQEFELVPTNSMENFSSIVCDQPNPPPTKKLFITPQITPYNESPPFIDPTPTPYRTPDPTPYRTPDPTPYRTPDPTPYRTPDPTPENDLCENLPVDCDNLPMCTVIDKCTCGEIMDCPGGIPIDPICNTQDQFVLVPGELEATPLNCFCCKLKDEGIL